MVRREPHPRKLLNLLVASTQFVLKHEVMKAWPATVKVDISPLYNLHCTVCVHGRPTENSGIALKAQDCNGRQKMRLDQFEQIMNEVSGKTMAVSMYYLGDPLVHPDLDAMCRIAWHAGLNSHVSTNFSFALSDERIASIVMSVFITMGPRCFRTIPPRVPRRVTGGTSLRQPRFVQSQAWA